MERRELFPNFFVKRRERETGSRGLGWGPSAGIFSRAQPSSQCLLIPMQQMLRGKVKKITKKKIKQKKIFFYSRNDVLRTKPDRERTARFAFSR
jgi:hypothetical protein